MSQSSNQPLPLASEQDGREPEEGARPSERPPVIDARHVQKRFGSKVVLQDLSLRVRPGEIFGLIGPSGSGKSTTIHLLCGHQRPTDGVVRVFGEDPVRFTTASRRRIGYMPQNFILYPDLTVHQNVSFAAGLYGMAEWSYGDRIRETLDLVELWEARGQAARDVSGGMQRRIALAAALVHDPDLLFADEPTANLDPILRGKLWKHFRSLCDAGKALLITTQYIDEAEYCDRVGLMFDGALIAEGDPEALRRKAFGGDIVEFRVDEPTPEHARKLARLDSVRDAHLTDNDALRVTVENADSAIPALLDALEEAGTEVRSVSQPRPTFDEVFIRLIELHGRPRPPVGRLQTSGVEGG